MVGAATSCTDLYQEDDAQSSEEEITPPSETYHHEDDKQYCLNVIYYVPSDAVEVSDWHYRLSGMTLKIQEYFEENFGYYGVNRKMGLVVNDSSASYVKMHHIKSQYIGEELHSENKRKMADEILAYFQANPDEKTSDHYLVWMPEYPEGFVDYYFPDTKSGMTFAAVDNDRFKPSYWASARATATFLSSFGLILKTFAHSLFLAESSTGVQNPYMSLMDATEVQGGSRYSPRTPKYNYTQYTGTAGSTYTAGIPDKVRLMYWDVRYLAGTQLFNDEYSYEPFTVKVDREKVRIWSRDTAASAGGQLTTDWWQQDTVWMEVHFETDADLAGVLVLDDAWLYTSRTTNYADTTGDRNPMMDTGEDALAVFFDAANFERNGDQYKATFAIPIGEHLCFGTAGRKITSNTNLIPHELRLRFIGRNGMCYPHYPVSIKGDTPNWDQEGIMDSDLRYGFKYLYKRSIIQGKYNYFPYCDIPWRYNGWVMPGETEPHRPGESATN